MKKLKKLHGIVLLATFFVMSCAKEPGPTLNLNTESYIVVLKHSEVQVASTSLSSNLKAAGASGKISANAVVAQMLSDVALEHEIANPTQVFSQVIQGGVYQLSSNEAESLALDPKIAYIEKDQIFRANAVIQSDVTWGLDRIDQAQLPLNKTYSYPDSGGRNVNVYVIDTGIRTTHEQFGGRADSAFDFVDNDADATDCNGHGTHVAGTIGSRSYGVAKNAKLHGVRVLDCDGSGTTSGVIAGVEWVTAHHVKPAVANMSLGGGASKALDDAIAASIRAGVTYAVAAGNEDSNACDTSPARLPEAITVASTTKSDSRSDFSNYGTCISVFAPGSDITSTWSTSDSATNKISGTSMATPHVVGVAALYLSEHTAATPAEVKAALLAASSQGRVSDPKDSPNKIINTAFMLGTSPPPQPPPSSGNQLVNNVAVAGVANESKSADKAYTFEVPVGSKKLIISTSGGRGDVDIYVKFGSKPTGSNYDCRPYKTGNNESCSLASPRSGTWHVVLKTYAPYSGVSLKAQFQ